MAGPEPEEDDRDETPREPRGLLERLRRFFSTTPEETRDPRHIQSEEAFGWVRGASPDPTRDPPRDPDPEPGARIPEPPSGARHDPVPLLEPEAPPADEVDPPGDLSAIPFTVPDPDPATSRRPRVPTPEPETPDAEPHRHHPSSHAPRPPEDPEHESGQTPGHETPTDPTRPPEPQSTGTPTPTPTQTPIPTQTPTLDPVAEPPLPPQIQAAGTPLPIPTPVLDPQAEPPVPPQVQAAGTPTPIPTSVLDPQAEPPLPPQVQAAGTPSPIPTPVLDPQAEPPQPPQVQAAGTPTPIPTPILDPQAEPPQPPQVQAAGTPSPIPTPVLDPQAEPPLPPQVQAASTPSPIPTPILDPQAEPPLPPQVQAASTPSPIPTPILDPQAEPPLPPQVQTAGTPKPIPTPVLDPQAEPPQPPQVQDAGTPSPIPTPILDPQAEPPLPPQVQAAGTPSPIPTPVLDPQAEPPLPPQVQSAGTPSPIPTPVLVPQAEPPLPPQVQAAGTPSPIPTPILDPQAEPPQPPQVQAAGTPSPIPTPVLDPQAEPPLPPQVQAAGTPSPVPIPLAHPAQITGDDRGATIEDGRLATGGRLLVADPDPGEAAFVPISSSPGLHGVFDLHADGTWTYTLDNASTEVQGLRPFQTLVDTLVVTSIDGAAHDINVTVTGAHDAPRLEAATASAFEDGPRIQGNLPGTDADFGDTLTYAVSSAPEGFSLAPDGAWSFEASAAVYQSLAPGSSVPLRIPVTVTDESGLTSSSTLTITVHGTNDGPAVTGVTRLPDGMENVPQVVTTETLLSHAVDIDLGDRLSVSELTADHGVFSANADGSWTFHPETDYDGPVEISYLVTDMHGAQAPAQAVLMLASPPAIEQVQGAGTQQLSGAMTGGSGGWAIDNGHGVGVTTLRGDYGTLTIDPDTGQFHYHYDPESEVIKSRFPTGAYGDQVDDFGILRDGVAVGQAEVDVRLDLQHVHGNSGHHIDHTTLQGITLVPTDAAQTDEADGGDAASSATVQILAPAPGADLEPGDDGGVPPAVVPDDDRSPDPAAVDDPRSGAASPTVGLLDPADAAPPAADRGEASGEAGAGDAETEMPMAHYFDAVGASGAQPDDGAAPRAASPYFDLLDMAPSDAIGGGDPGLAGALDPQLLGDEATDDPDPIKPSAPLDEPPDDVASYAPDADHPNGTDPDPNA